MTQAIRSVFVAIALAIAASASGQTLGTPGTEIVWLVTDCDASGHDEGVDCFESVSALQAYVWGTGAPSTGGIDPDAGDPLIVEIGPGTFSGHLTCEDNGWVTFRGAGRDRSEISYNGFVGAFYATDCHEVAFQDLAIRHTTNIGVTVIGASTTTWTDVDITGSFAGWYDQGCGGSATAAPAGEHFFWGVKFEGEVNAFFAECARSWIFGSDLVARPVDAPTNNNAAIIAVRIAHRAEVNVFGSNVEATMASTSSNVITDAYGIWVGSNGNNVSTGYGAFEMHGGRIRVDASNLAGVDAVGMNVFDSGTGDASARVLEDGFELKEGSGATATRLMGDGSIASPFLLPSGTAAPATVSLTGQDLFVDTDCATAGCNSTGTEPHLLIYSSTCTSKWFDVVTGACKP
jgi:hypothetical protein